MLDYIAFPKGFDRRLIEQLLPKALSERERRFNEANEALRKQSEAHAQYLDPSLDPKELQRKLAEERKKLTEQFRDRKPPPFQPFRAHNPAYYAPFDATFSATDDGTVGSLHGPDATTGEVGANLIDESGPTSSVVSVGVWHYAQAESTLYVTIQASVFGQAFTWAPFDVSSAFAYAGLRVYIEQFNLESLGLERVITATTDIYESGFLGAYSRGINDWDNRTVTIAIPPVASDSLYLIWADAVQQISTNIGGALSDFIMHIGPISHFTV
jgi:hypothetical protein